jgi:hypothetical protein
MAVMATMPPKMALQHTRRSYSPERHHVAASACNAARGHAGSTLSAETA